MHDWERSRMITVVKVGSCFEARIGSGVQLKTSNIQLNDVQFGVDLLQAPQLLHWGL